MKKEEGKNVENGSVRKTTFTPEEHSGFYMDLEFIKTTLDVSMGCSDDITPILGVAFDKADALMGLIAGMHPVKEVTT